MFNITSIGDLSQGTTSSPDIDYLRSDLVFFHGLYHWSLQRETEPWASFHLIKAPEKHPSMICFRFVPYMMFKHPSRVFAL